MEGNFNRKENDEEKRLFKSSCSDSIDICEDHNNICKSYKNKSNAKKGLSTGLVALIVSLILLSITLLIIKVQLSTSIFIDKRFDDDKKKTKISHWTSMNLD